MFTSKDIKWIKNVKSKQGVGWAYENVFIEKPFLLNWPTRFKGSSLTPQIGDIIVLFQNPLIINGIKNYTVHLTHLVSPISPEMIIDSKNPNHRYCRLVQLIAKSFPIESIPNPGYFNFFKPNRGATNPIINLENNINLSESKTKDRIWGLFSKYMDPKISDRIIVPQYDVDENGVNEGDKEISEHISMENVKRNSQIVKQKKDIALKENSGHINCECCNFDFMNTFGNHGFGFIECHHNIHIAIGERFTRLEDLSLVCPNCHRMLHKRNKDGNFMTINDLKSIIKI